MASLALSRVDNADQATTTAASSVDLTKETHHRGTEKKYHLVFLCVSGPLWFKSDFHYPIVARRIRECYNTYLMGRTRSQFGQVLACVLLTAVVCLQFCATTCALGNCTSQNLERFKQSPVAQKAGHCHQNSREGQPAEKPKKDDNNGCHSANEVIAAFTDNGNFVAGNDHSPGFDLAALPANAIPSIAKNLRNAIKPLTFESPPKRAVITALRI